jgi:hypothetical protein
MSKGNIFVERRPNGIYAVERPGAERASAILLTQRAAINRAKEISPGSRLITLSLLDSNVVLHYYGHEG